MNTSLPGWRKELTLLCPYIKVLSKSNWLGKQILPVVSAGSLTSAWCVVVWLTTAPIGSHIWMLSHSRSGTLWEGLGGLALLEHMHPCFRKHVTGGEHWSMLGLALSLSPHVDQDVTQLLLPCYERCHAPTILCSMTIMDQTSET